MHFHALRARQLTFFALCIAALFIPTIALAQSVDAGVTDPLVTDLGTVAQAASTLNTTGIAGTLTLIVASLVLVTRLLTRFGKALPGVVGIWFGSPQATWILPMVLSIGGALITALTSGQPLSLMLFVGAVMTGLAGGGFGSVPAKLEQLKKADAAGSTAAAAVDSKGAAVSELGK